MSGEKAYVLGTHDAELTRLGLQHRLWRPRASAAWARAGFTLGQTLLDVGCGPGYAALDLAELVGPSGRIVAMDRSRRYLDALEAGARARAISNIETHELDLDAQTLPDVVADGAWSRWIYAFLSRPEALLDQVVARVRPGGVIVMHEYVDYRAWRVSPAQPAFERFVEHVVASWRENGGEPDVGLDLPRWLTARGCALVETRSISEITRPGDALWPWPDAFVEVGLARLVELGRVSENEAGEVRAAWAATAATPGGFAITPTVIEVVARRL